MRISEVIALISTVHTVISFAFIDDSLDCTDNICVIQDVAMRCLSVARASMRCTDCIYANSLRCVNCSSFERAYGQKDTNGLRNSYKSS